MQDYDPWKKGVKYNKFYIHPDYPPARKFQIAAQGGGNPNKACWSCQVEETEIEIWEAQRS